MTTTTSSTAKREARNDMVHTYVGIQNALVALLTRWEDRDYNEHAFGEDEFPFDVALEEQIARLGHVIERLSQRTPDEYAAEVLAHLTSTGDPRITPHNVALAMRSLGHPVGDATIMDVYNAARKATEPKTLHPSIDVLEAAGYPYNATGHTEPITWAEFGDWLIKNR